MSVISLIPFLPVNTAFSAGYFIISVGHLTRKGKVTYSYIYDMRKWLVCLLFNQLNLFTSTGQVVTDRKYIADYKEPYVIRISLERTGAGVEISPDNTLVPPTASFPFNTGTNLGVYLSYKFINFSVSQSLRSSTNNRSLVIAGNVYHGANNFGGKFGFYNNVASVKDKKTIDVRSSVNLFKFSPCWLINTNHKRLSLEAISDYSKRQRLSAGAFMFELNPNLLISRGRNGPIIPGDRRYEPLFENQTGLQNLTIVNIDFRPGYLYTKAIEDGKYFISGGLFLGPGFGFHVAKAAIHNESGMHWQSSVRMLGSAGYNGDRYFLVAAFRYTNSFTPVSSIGVLSDEGTILLTFGIRFNELEKKLPDTWEELLHKRKKRY